MSNRPNIVLFLTVLVSVFMCANMVESQYVEEGLVGYWPLDDATIKAVTVEDVKGENDGTIKGADVQMVEGRFGEALQFNQPADYLDLGIGNNEVLAGTVTLELWFKFTQLELGADPAIFMCNRKGDWAAGEGITIMYLNNRLRPNGDREGFNLAFNSHREDGMCDLWYEPFEPKNEDWYHYAGTYDGTTMISYVNGDNVDQRPCVKPASEASRALRITDSQQFGNNWNFIGVVDEIRIYDRALNEAEVKKNFSGDTAVENSTEKLSLTWGEIKVSR